MISYAILAGGQTRTQARCIILVHGLSFNLFNQFDCSQRYNLSYGRIKGEKFTVSSFHIKALQSKLRSCN